jgi:DNA-binding NtrC family response regulator
MDTASNLLNNTEKYSVLVIEDNLGDFALVEEFLLEKVNAFDLHHTRTFKDTKLMLSKRNARNFDAILLDLSLPDKTGIDLINEIVALCNGTPVIILTGHDNFCFGLKSVSLGVSDYIIKDELTPQLLYKSILYSIEHKKTNLDLVKHVAAIEEQNKKLREIAWIQSHLVRGPLARIMGLIDLLNNYENNQLDEDLIKNYILTSAKELDDVINDIIGKVYTI